MRIYENLRFLARSDEYQNLFYALKEVNGLQLFENKNNLSRLQNLFLTYLYMYSSIQKDLIVHKISKNISKSFLREDSYLFWKKEVGFTEDKKIKNKAFEFPIGKEIIFPTKEVK